MKNTAQRLAAVRESIHIAGQKYGREEDSVKLLAVSKSQPAAALREAVAAGQREFGENYVQEAQAKMAALDDPRLCWHFIGPVQSNKTRAIAARFHWLHSLDRLKIAQRLNEARPPALPPLNVCIQVNISGEDTKSGVNPEGLEELATAVVRLPRLRLRGLMAMPAPLDDFDEQRRSFRALRHCLEELRGSGLELDTLSMGTSADMEAAIAEGATIVRIGTAVFGPRPAARRTPN